MTSLDLLLCDELTTERLTLPIDLLESGASPPKLPNLMLKRRFSALCLHQPLRYPWLYTHHSATSLRIGYSLASVSAMLLPTS